MFLFTDFLDVETQFIMGYSFIFCLCGILALNAGYMIRNMIGNWSSKRRKEANQKSYEALFKLWLEEEKVRVVFKKIRLNKRKMIVDQIFAGP